MEVFIFKTPAGQSVAVPDDDIATVWAAEKKGHMLIVRLTDQPVLEVVYDFDEFVKDFFDHVDLRPEQAEAIPLPAEPTPIVLESNVIAVDFKNHGKK